MLTYLSGLFWPNNSPKDIEFNVGEENTRIKKLEPEMFWCLHLENVLNDDDDDQNICW